MSGGRAAIGLTQVVLGGYIELVSPQVETGFSFYSMKDSALIEN